MNYFEQMDLYVLRLINVDWAIPDLDQFWLQITHLEHQAWFRMLLPFLLIGLIYIYRGRLVPVVVATGLAVGISDFLAYRVVKALVQRPRPFANPETVAWLRKVGEAQGTSFPSNHAANCFAAATVLAWYFPGQGKYFYIFAALVAYSRIVLGVHYPADVVSGAMLGIVVGYLIRGLLLNRVNWFRLANNVSSADRNSRPRRTRFGRT